MKKVLQHFGLLVLLAISSFTFAQKMIPVEIGWKSINIEVGYDHNNKMMIYLDGNKIGESSVSKQSEHNSIKLTVPKGNHEIKIVNYAYYQGEWEIHSIANNYSVDAIVTRDLPFAKATKIEILFDLDNPTPNVRIEGGEGKSSKSKGKQVTAAIDWKFINVVDGFDHKTKMKIYVDGEFVSESTVTPGSKGNSMQVKLSSGSHKITIENYTLYEGEWEIRSIDNGYSTEGTVERNLNFSKKSTKISIIYDIDNPEPLVTIN